MKNIYFAYTLEELRETVSKEPSNRKAKEALCMKIAEERCGGKIPLNHLFIDERHLEENLTEKEEWDEQ